MLLRLVACSAAAPVAAERRDPPRRDDGRFVTSPARAGLQRVTRTTTTTTRTPDAAATTTTTTTTTTEFYLGLYAPSHSWASVEIGLSNEPTVARTLLPMMRAASHDCFFWISLGTRHGEHDYVYLLGARAPSRNGSAASAAAPGSMRLIDPLSRRVIGGRTRITLGAGGASGADDFVWSQDMNEWRARRPSLGELAISPHLPSELT